MNNNGRARGLKKIGEVIFENIVWVMFLAMICVLGMFEPGMFSVNILLNIVRQASVLGILALGVSFTLLLGEIDLSATGNMGVAAFLGIIAMKAGLPWYLAVVLIIVIGGLIGLFNGLVITQLGAVPLMVTLSMNMVLQGILLFGTRGVTVTNLPEAYKFIGQGKVFGVDLLPLVFLAICLIVAVLWEKTVLGRSIFAVGGNRFCAQVSGIKVEKIRILSYTICGLTAGLGGFLLSSYLGSITSAFGGNYQMIAIASSVIGGISITGGRGRVFGVMGGVFLITVVKVGLQVAGLDAYFTQFVEGLMVFIAVLIDSTREKYQNRH